MSTTCRFWIRVGHGVHHHRDARLRNCLCARWCQTMVVTRFQRDVQSCAARVVAFVARIIQCIDLCVGVAINRMPTLTDDLVIAHDHTADQRIGAGTALTSSGKPQGMLHVMFVMLHYYLKPSHSLAKGRQQALRQVGWRTCFCAMRKHRRTPKHTLGKATRTHQVSDQLLSSGL